jgi:hypothetical protein
MPLDPEGHDLRHGSTGCHCGSTGQQPRVRPAARAGVHDRSRPQPGRRALPLELGERSREADGADGGAATDGDGEGPPPTGPQVVGQRVLRDLERIPGRHAREVELGAEEARQELVAGRFGRGVAAEHQVDRPAQAGAGRRGHSAVVGLAGADRDQRVRAGRLRRAAEQLQLPGLVASHAQAGQVVTLHPEPGAPRQHRPPLQGSGERGQRHPGRRDQGPVERLEGCHVV